jgi:hypothetical protein
MFKSFLRERLEYAAPATEPAIIPAAMPKTITKCFTTGEGEMKLISRCIAPMPSIMPACQTGEQQGPLPCGEPPRSICFQKTPADHVHVRAEPTSIAPDLPHGLRERTRKKQPTRTMARQEHNLRSKGEGRPSPHRVALISLPPRFLIRKAAKREM